MGNKFCVNCGTPMAENAAFCPGCGQKAEPAEQTYAYTAAPPQTPQQAGGYYQQPPSQTNAYYQQPPAAPGPGAPYYQPQPPSGGYPYTGYGAPAGAGRKKGSKGVLIGGIIGLVVLAAGIVAAVLLLGKPPAPKPGSGGNPSVAASVPGSQGNNEKPPASDIKTDAALADITGMWEGELLFTRLEGFDKIPADELPENFDEMLREMLNEPAPMTFEIREDGGWELYADVDMGMWFDSSDFGDADVSPLLLTGLKNGTFDVSYSEKVDEDDIQGNAAFSLSGTVREDDEGLYIQGILLITMKMADATIIEEAGFRVTFSGPSDTYETNDWEDDTDTGSSTIPDGTSLSTAVRPDLSDFLWYMDGVYYDGLPYDMEPITDFAELTGGWKAFFYYDPENTMDAYGYEFLNVAIDGNASGVTMTVDWYKMYLGDEEYDFSDTEDSLFYGAYDSSGMTVSGDGYSIFIPSFYYQNGRQYAAGFVELQSGEPTFVALVRP